MQTQLFLKKLKTQINKENFNLQKIPAFKIQSGHSQFTILQTYRKHKSTWEIIKPFAVFEATAQKVSWKFSGNQRVVLLNKHNKQKSKFGDCKLKCAYYAHSHMRNAHYLFELLNKHWSINTVSTTKYVETGETKSTFVKCFSIITKPRTGSWW
jgi:hypothetical protein